MANLSNMASMQSGKYDIWLLTSRSKDTVHVRPMMSRQTALGTRQSETRALIDDFTVACARVTGLTLSNAVVQFGWACLLTLGAMATVRGAPDWIWLTGQQGWARQTRTRCPDWVRLRRYVCVRVTRRYGTHLCARGMQHWLRVSVWRTMCMWVWVQPALHSN